MMEEKTRNTLLLNMEKQRRAPKKPSARDEQSLPGAGRDSQIPFSAPPTSS